MRIISVVRIVLLLRIFLYEIVFPHLKNCETVHKTQAIKMHVIVTQPQYLSTEYWDIIYWGRILLNICNTVTLTLYLISCTATTLSFEVALTFISFEAALMLQLVFNPAREFDMEFASSKDVQTHFMASAVRLKFLKPSGNSPLSSYYAVADLVIEGQCACFGHANRCSGEVTMYRLAIFIVGGHYN